MSKRKDEKQNRGPDIVAPGEQLTANIDTETVDQVTTDMAQEKAQAMLDHIHKATKDVSEPIEPVFPGIEDLSERLDQTFPKAYDENREMKPEVEELTLTNLEAAVLDRHNSDLIQLIVKKKGDKPLIEVVDQLLRAWAFGQIRL